MTRGSRPWAPRREALLAGLVSAALAACAVRPWGLGLLALVAYVPAFTAVTRARRAVDGAAAAATASLGVASVGYLATIGIFPGAYFVALLLAALPYALVGGLTVRLGRTAALGRLPASWRHFALLSALGALWCAAEFVPARPDLLGVWALPFGAIGYSQVGLPTAQLARLSSVTAVSAAVLLANVAVSGLWEAVGRRRSGPAWTAATLLALTAGGVAAAANLGAAAAEPGAPTARAATSAGSAAAAEPHLSDRTGPPAGGLASAPAALTVRLVQPNLRDSVYAAAAEHEPVASAVAAAIAALAVGDADERPAGGATNGGTPTGGVPTGGVPTVTLLPEASWPGVVRARRTARPAAAPLLEAGAPVLLGAVTAGFDGSAGAPVAARGHDEPTAVDPRLANSVVLVKDGELTPVYDKRRLVPIAEAGLRPGQGPRLVALGDVSIAPFVCYDIVFPADARAAARLGAELFAVLTDDAFAARSDVPLLHLRVATMRAIETGVPVALVGNTGPSAVITASGRVVAATRPLEATSLTATVSAGAGTTPYVSNGDLIGNAAAFLSLGLAALGAAGGGARELDKGPT